MTKAPVRLSDLFRYYKGEPHQMAAIEMLSREIPAELMGRDREWFSVWSQAGKKEEPSWLQPALTIIKQFEGCRLVAYPDPGTGGDPWTIGWGTTSIDGRPVRKGDTLSQQRADELLHNEIEHFAKQVLDALPLAAAWPGNQTAAIISWAYNVGANAMRESTLRARLLDGEPPKVVVHEELPKWNRGGSGVLEGLVRRRAAEVSLFVNGEPGSKKASAAQPMQQGAAKLAPSSPFSAHMTPNITLGEFALGQEARRFTAQHQLDTAAELAAFLERARRNFGNKPVIITSGYRPAAVNRSVGGASQSEHLYDAPSVGAVDFYIDGVDINAVQAYCDKEWPYSVGYGAPKGFVHLGIRQGRPKVRWDY